jgi:hypothetical protein
MRLEWARHTRMRGGSSVSLADEERVQEGPIGEKDISEEAPIPVNCLLVEFKAEGLCGQEPPKEEGGLLSEGFRALSRVSGLGGVDPDEADGKPKGVPIDEAGGPNLKGLAIRQEDQKGDDEGQRA